MAEQTSVSNLPQADRNLGYPVVDYGDVESGQLNLAVWLRAATEPQQNYQLDVVSASGSVLLTDTAKTQDRILADGSFEPRSLSFTLPVNQLAKGNFKLQLTCLDTSVTTQVRPSPGLLASSRPRVLNKSGNTIRRYQFFPGVRIRWGKKGPRPYPRVVLRVGDMSAKSRAWWVVRNFLLDLAFLLYGKRFGFSRIWRKLTSNKAGPGPIWLIGERSDTARDNGIRFFEYLRREHPQLRAYYVIDEASPMVAQVLPLGNVVFHSSKEHRLLMHHADVLANAYSIKHMAPHQWNSTIYGSYFSWKIGSRRVYLKHGVHDKTSMFKRGTNGLDLVVTVGPKEGAAFEQDSGYTKTQLKEVGLPRYDTLVREPGHRTILLMLTWRRYFVPKLFGDTDEVEQLFAGSRYENFLKDFLGSDQLAQVLQANDLRLVLVPHYNMATEANGIPIASDRIEVLDGATADIPKLLRQCDLLITDYSSVHFDVAYLGTPVIYTRFDREEYQAGHASTSWFSYEKDGFGPVVETVADTINEIARYAEQDFTNDPKYVGRLESIFTYRDQLNCERLYREIVELEKADKQVR